MPNSTVIQMDSYKKTRIERELFDLNQCVILNNYYLSVLPTSDEKYAYQQMLLADNMMQIEQFQNQLKDIQNGL